MPNDPITAAQRHRRSGELSRIRRLAQVEIPIGATTFIRARSDRGLTIGKRNTLIHLNRDEAEQLITAAQELTK